MVVKRYRELVVAIAKDAPQVSIKLGYCDVDGATYTRRRGFTSILSSDMDTGSGRIGDGDSTSEKKHPTRIQIPSVRVV